ncbi:MAG: type II toxin-antitoxin system VapC family toxin [Desulfobacterales bacterium]|nr:type II toxin-antitoxin system VapC family toxin [Desulfobacterales bacterium]
MKGLDTNILVRYISQDDPEQSAVANEVIEGFAEDKERFVIQPVVLCEMVWVLESAYKHTKSEIVLVLNQILRTVQFEITNKDIVWQAFIDYHNGKADFSDCFIGRANKKAGADVTLTFDKGLGGYPRFQVLI